MEMAEPASRIESASSYREPDGNRPPVAAKEKTRSKAKAVGSLLDRLQPDEPDESERHQLDTLA
jgi:hypothetical protein